MSFFCIYECVFINHLRIFDHVYIVHIFTHVSAYKKISAINLDDRICHRYSIKSIKTKNQRKRFHGWFDYKIQFLMFMLCYSLCTKKIICGYLHLRIGEFPSEVCGTENETLPCEFYLFGNKICRLIQIL